MSVELQKYPMLHGVHAVALTPLLEPAGQEKHALSDVVLLKVLAAQETGKLVPPGQ
jgi:hypothetical protein